MTAPTRARVLAPIVITSANNAIAGVDGGGAFVASITAGVYYWSDDGTASDMCVAIVTALEAAGNTDDWSAEISSEIVSITNEDSDGWTLDFDHASTTIDASIWGVTDTSAAFGGDTGESDEPPQPPLCAWISTTGPAYDLEKPRRASVNQNIAADGTVWTNKWDTDSRDRPVRFEYEPGAKVLVPTTATNEDWPTAIQPYLYTDNAVRYYPDKDTSGTYSAGIIDAASLEDNSPVRIGPGLDVYSFDFVLQDTTETVAPAAAAAFADFNSGANLFYGFEEASINVTDWEEIAYDKPASPQGEQSRVTNASFGSNNLSNHETYCRYFQFAHGSFPTDWPPTNSFGIFRYLYLDPNNGGTNRFSTEVGTVTASIVFREHVTYAAYNQPAPCLLTRWSSDITVPGYDYGYILSYRTVNVPPTTRLVLQCKMEIDGCYRDNPSNTTVAYANITPLAKDDWHGIKIKVEPDGADQLISAYKVAGATAVDTLDANNEPSGLSLVFTIRHTNGSAVPTVDAGSATIVSNFHTTTPIATGKTGFAAGSWAGGGTYGESELYYDNFVASYEAP